MEMFLQEESPVDWQYRTDLNIHCHIRSGVKGNHVDQQKSVFNQHGISLIRRIRMSRTQSLIKVMFFALLAIMVAFPNIPASAGSEVWTSHGPEGGPVKYLVIDPVNPTTLYAGLWWGGVFKSTNGGVQWNEANTGLTSHEVRSLAIDPITPSTLYVGLYRGFGLFKSTNGGGSWASASNGLPSNYNISSLAVNPSTPSILYAGVASSGTTAGIYKSTNGGDSWIAASTGLPTSGPNSIAVDPVNSDTVYTGFYSTHGIYKSVNGGSLWKPVNSGLPASPQIMTLVIDTDTPSTLYAGLLGGGVYKSTDSGLSWSEINTGLTNLQIQHLLINPQAPNILFAGTFDGVFSSVNGGATWVPVNTGLIYNRVYSLAIDPLNTDIIYAGTNGGVSKSEGKTISWSSINTGLTKAMVSALAIHPEIPGTLFAGTYPHGVYKSTNRGDSWLETNDRLPIPIGVNAIVFHPGQTNTLYMGAYGLGVFRSTNGGTNWSEFNTGLTVTEIYSLAIDPNGTLYAGTDGGGVFKRDEKVQWAAINKGLTDLHVYTLAIDPSTPSTLYAGTEDFVFKSINSGGTWTAAYPALAGTAVDCLAIDPVNPSTLYAGTLGGIYKSEDSGLSWEHIGLSSYYIDALAVHPRNPLTIIAGSINHGAYKSTDGGISWDLFNTGLTASAAIRALEFDQLDPRNLYAGTDGGVFTMKVGPALIAPNITNGNNTTFMVGNPGTFTVTTSGYPTPTLSSSGSLPDGVTFNDIGDGTATLAGTPAAGTAGEYVIEITASNGVLPNATQTFTLTVVAAPTAPAITSGNNTTFMVGSPGTFTVTTSGYPTPTLSKTGGLPSGVTFTDDGHGTATLAGTPAAGTAGDYVIDITASNGVEPNATQVFTLKIRQPGEGFSIFLPLILR
jgi:photosystem II stability/assembly factor-like uncharacterized protein